MEWGTNNLECELIVLGNTYIPNNKDSIPNYDNPMLKQLFNKLNPWDKEFLADVQTRLNFTYRTKVVPILRHQDGPSPLNFSVCLKDNPLNVIENVIGNPDYFYSDIGWGCMIRTGQSLLGNALQRIKLGREYRVERDVNETELEIVKWFQDDRISPFSLQRFVESGFVTSNKKPGEWFGPSATSRSIQSLVSEFPQCGIDHCIISTDSADIYVDEISPLFKTEPNTNLLLLLGVKLGVNNVNSVYWNGLKELLSSKQSVGISGGRPSSSLYFFGFQGNFLFYLDPHTVNLNLCLYKNPSELMSSVHSSNFNKIHIRDVDPSMLIGILIQGENDWNNWCDQTLTSDIIHLCTRRSENVILDGDIKSICSIDNEESKPSSELRNELVEGEYVDVGSMFQQAKTSGDEYQNVKCINQNIVIFGDHNDSDSIDLEVEKVLVEKETVPVYN